MSDNSPKNPQHVDSDAFAAAVVQFGEAVTTMQRGDLEGARAAFETLAAATTEEPALSERARTYARICSLRTAPPEAEPTTVDELYVRGVMLSNNGNCDEAIRMFDRAIQAEPVAARHLYARSSAYALKGNVDAAIADLRQSIALDPATRFQAVNDPDFEQIREEPSFIDIIEPTPTGE